MKKTLASIFTAIMIFTLAVPAFAKCEGGHCPMKGKRGEECASKGACSSKGDCCKDQCPITAKLMKKAHFYLENQKEIGLKEDQIKAIKAIKMETKKAEIRQSAEMQVFMMDLESKLSEPQLDTEGLNAMVDSMSSGFNSGAKATIAAYAKLKGILTADQHAKVKELWSGGGKGH